MAGTVVADQLEAASTSTLVLKNGVANTPPTVQDSAGTQIGTFCRAWVNFNGTGTVAIRASFNVSSITDNGTGDYTVNFTNALPDANYVTQVTTGNDAAGNTSYTGANVLAQATAPQTSGVRLGTWQSSGANNRQNADSPELYVAIFR